MSTPAHPLTLAFERTGHGRPLVLIHGITENHTSFGSVIGALAEHFDVLAVDLRGHGDSPNVAPYDLETMAADVAHTVGHVWPDGPAPVVVGHSLGGAVATAYAARYPIAGVVNVDQSMDLAGFQEMVRGAEPMLRSDACEQVMVGLFEGMYGALPPEEADRLRALRDVRPESVLGVWGMLFDLDRAELAAEVDRVMTNPAPSPYLAIHGQDPGPAYPQWLQQRIPGAEVEVWADLGHYPHLVRPDEFVATVVTLAEV